MALKVEQINAKRLFVEENKTIEEIEKLIPNVSSATLYRWKNEGDWDRQREEMSATSMSAEKEMLKTAVQGIINLNKTIKVTGQVPGKDAYNLRLLINSALALTKEIDMLGYLMKWGDKFTAFLQQEDPALLEKLLPHLQKFGKVMIEESRRK